MNQNLRDYLTELNGYDLLNLADDLRAIRDNVKTGDYPLTGICHALSVNTGIEPFFRAWPEFSGSTMYPVPGPEEYREEAAVFCWADEEEEGWADDEALAEYAYENLDRWFGEYGDTRLRLLDFMIEQIEEFLAEEEKPAPVTAAAYKPAHGGYPGIVR